MAAINTRDKEHGEAWQVLNDAGFECIITLGAIEVADDDAEAASELLKERFILHVIEY